MTVLCRYITCVHTTWWKEFIQIQSAIIYELEYIEMIELLRDITIIICSNEKTAGIVSCVANTKKKQRRIIEYDMRIVVCTYVYFLIMIPHIRLGSVCFHTQK